jgi:hypothetical protein
VDNINQGGACALVYEWVFRVDGMHIGNVALSSQNFFAVTACIRDFVLEAEVFSNSLATLVRPAFEPNARSKAL